MKYIVVLGATGSVGCQSLEVINAFQDKFTVVALSANRNMATLFDQILQFKPQIVCVGTDDSKHELEDRLKTINYQHPLNIVQGDEGLLHLATLSEACSVLNGLVGFTGLAPTIAALKAGKQVITANKETMVTAGHLLKPYLSQIIPLDSEHSAIFQCLQAVPKPWTRKVRRLVLTASGGPFLNTPLDELDHLTATQALRHPKWNMGDRITIDCATLMNKGFERLEAAVLFDLPLADIRVVIHPESIVHSAITLVDGSMLAQMGQPDMRGPIIYGLSYPERWATPFSDLHLDLDLTGGALNFQPLESVDVARRYPCYALAEHAATVGGSLPTVLNAADELAVEAFLQGRIRFTDIARHVERALAEHERNGLTAQPDLETILSIDAATRRLCQSALKQPV